MHFEAYADTPDGEPYYHFVIIEPKNFVIESIADVIKVYREIIECGEDNPGMIPIVHIEDRREI